LIDLDFLTGRTTDQLVPFQEGKHLVHREMNQSLVDLFNAAKNEGFDLAITSTFRSFETQKIIWNEKSQGLRAVLDSNSIPVDLSSKSNEEILFLILRWSAIPGGSRHHWGTDLDVFDKLAIPADYKVQLIPSEYESQGPFYQLSLWLNENLDRFGFFRPYSRDCDGIAPEPWHLSYRPLSEKLLAEYTYDRFVEHLNLSDFRLLEEALDNSFEIYQRFIKIP
jgi:LAS superfamily LD-carboxypeptidase LdcB